jgi:hypothetical protein
VNRHKYIRLKFHLDGTDRLWLTHVQTAQTFNKLKMLLYAFEHNVSWHLSWADVLCNLCVKANDEHATLNEKEKSHLCNSSFHLRCQAEYENQKAAGLTASSSSSSSSQEPSVGLFKVNNVLQCVMCKQDEDEKKKLLLAEFEKKTPEAKELNTIEISTYSLRLNKARIEK